MSRKNRDIISYFTIYMRHCTVSQPNKNEDKLVMAVAVSLRHYISNVVDILQPSFKDESPPEIEKTIEFQNLNMILKGSQIKQYILEPVPGIQIICQQTYLNYQNGINICQVSRLVYNALIFWLHYMFSSRVKVYSNKYNVLKSLAQ